MHVELQEGLSLEKAHVISEEVEARIKERFKDLESITVHVGLAHRKKTRIAIPVANDRGLDSSVSLHFGSVPFFAFIDVEEGQIVSSYIKMNKGARLSHKRGIMAADLLVEENVDVVLAGGIGEGPFQILGDNLIQIYSISKPMKVTEAVNLLNKASLQRMTSPTEEHGEEKLNDNPIFYRQSYL
jgi:predicted Fe-Mo cluster-binding NifX family protein